MNNPATYRETVSFIEEFHSRQMLHQSLGRLMPLELERRSSAVTWCPQKLGQLIPTPFFSLQRFRPSPSQPAHSDAKGRSKISIPRQAAHGPILAQLPIAPIALIKKRRE